MKLKVTTYEIPPSWDDMGTALRGQVVTAPEATRKQIVAKILYRHFRRDPIMGWNIKKIKTASKIVEDTEHNARSNPRRRRNPANRKPGYVKPGYGIGDKATVQAVFRGSHFETNPYSVAAIKAVYGKRAARFDSFFMYPHSSGVTSVWGMKGVAPYNHNTVTMVGTEMT